MDARCDAAAGRPSPVGHRRLLLRLLAPVVLLGLWLMHGVSATTTAGCHGVPVLMSMSAQVGDPGSVPGTATVPMVRSVKSAAAGSAGTAWSAGAVSDRPGSNETCLSGQPPSPGGVLLALLAALALAGFGFSWAAAYGPRPPWRAASLPPRRGPPGPVGRALLTTVCISRT
jgi:hypothetical protein